ncbi:choline transporter-like protein 4 [Tachysurus ichikawai]
MVVSLLFLLLLRFLAAILIWILILGVLAVGAFGIWYCYNEYALLANSTLTYNNVGFTTNVNVYLQIRDTWLAFCKHIYIRKHHSFSYNMGKGIIKIEPAERDS